MSDLSDTEIADLLGSLASDRQEFPLPWSYENGMLRDATGWMIAAPWKAAGTIIVHAVNTYEETSALLDEAQSALAECLEYFEDHGDADFDGEKFIPNNEMRIGMEVRAILAKLEARDA